MKFQQKGTIKGTEMLTFGQLSGGMLFIPVNEDGEIHIKDDDGNCTHLRTGIYLDCSDATGFEHSHPVIRVTGTLAYKKDPNQDPKGDCDED